MHLIFWQNILSIHQAPLISELASRFRVTIIAQEEISESRRSAGWRAPDMGSAEVIVAPNELKIKDIVNNNRCATHIFTGIKAFPMVYRAFRLAVRCECHIMVQMEPYENSGWKSIFRSLRYKWLKYKYEKHICAILATGSSGYRCYSKIGFPSSKVFEWGYFTKKQVLACTSQRKNDIFNILFVGRLDNNKQVVSLIREVINIKRYDVSLTIIGAGPLAQEIKAWVEQLENVHYVGSVPNDDIPTYMNQSDLLVLPSLYDGWGAVVNEALTCGTRVLCSSACGASCLLDGTDRGSVFSWEQTGSLQQHLVRWVSLGPISSENREKLAAWANHHISAKSAANYLISIVHYTKNKKKMDKPQAPWI